MEVVKDPGNDRDQVLVQMVNQYQGLLLRMCYIYLRDMELAKDYLKANCYAQFIPEPDMVKRGQIEGLLSYMLNVRYIHEEHRGGKENDRAGNLRESQNVHRKAGQRD